MLGSVRHRAYRTGPRSGSVRPSRWRVAVAALALAVLVVAPLLGIFHRAWVRHAVCEHGDLIEPERASASRADADDSDSDLSAAVAVRRDASATVHGHSHCAAGILAKSGVGVVAPAPVGTFVVWTRLVAPPPAQGGHARAVLASAPKTSPPASARSLA